MATGPTTRVADVVVPEVFTPYTRVLSEQKSRLIQSGVLTRNPGIDTFLQGGGITFTIPAMKDLDDDAERISTDTSVPFADADASLPAGVARPPNPLKIGTLTETGIRMVRNNSWSSTDLAAILAGIDPMNAIADRVATYWTRRLQAAFIATWKGVIADNTANDSGDYTVDISGASYSAGVTDFSAEAFIDAVTTMGDSMEDLRAIFVHSVVYARMMKNNLIDFIPDSEGRVNVSSFLGREVIIDDNMPRTGSVYEAWLFGAGATQFGDVDPPNATATERKEGGGNGGGQDVLYSRKMWCIHPTGHSWVGTAGNGGPANTGSAASDLDEAASWNRVYPERKQIKFARLITREA